MRPTDDFYDIKLSNSRVILPTANAYYTDVGTK